MIIKKKFICPLHASSLKAIGKLIDERQVNVALKCEQANHFWYYSIRANGVEEFHSAQQDTIPDFLLAEKMQLDGEISLPSKKAKIYKAAHKAGLV